MKSCHHCEYRIAGCHATCEAYAKDKQEHEAWVEMVKDARERQRDVEGVRTMTVEKYMKRSRREWR